MSDGRIVIDTKIDTSGLDDGIKDIENKMKGVKGTNFDGLKNAFKDAGENAKVLGFSVGDIGKAFSSTAGMAGLLGGAVGALASAFIDLAMRALQMAIQAMGDFIKQGIALSSSIQESMNVISVTFGKENTVTDWVNNTASAFNLAQDEAMKFSGTFGTIAKQMTGDKKAIEDISTTLTALSGDLASFYNTSNEEAFNALRAGLTGEMEQLKKFNVFMTEANLQQYALSQGIDESVRSMTEQEKQLLRLNYIMEQTTDAQTDAIRTQDSYANATKQLELAMKDASKSMGDEMLQPLADLQGFIKSFFEDNQALFSLIGNIFGTVIKVLTSVMEIASSVTLKPLLDSLNMVAEIINPILDGIEWMIDGIMKFFDMFTTTGKQETDAMAVYMQDFSDVSVKSMENVADATEDAFKDASKSIDGELGIVKDALEDYYDKDLKQYREYLDKKYGDSKGAEIKKAQLEADRDARNKRLMEQDLQNEEKKLQYAQQVAKAQQDALKAQEEAMKRQSNIVEQETKKQKGWFDDLKKSFDNMFTGGKSASYASGSYGYSRNAVAQSYSNYNRNSSTSNVFNVSLYGADFMSSMEQVQMMARLRG